MSGSAVSVFVPVGSAVAVGVVALNAVVPSAVMVDVFVSGAVVLVGSAALDSFCCAPCWFCCSLFKLLLGGVLTSSSSAVAVNKQRAMKTLYA